MPNSEPNTLRESGAALSPAREQADYPPFIVKAYNEIARSLERRALVVSRL
jgi:hypothetical protein